MILTVTLNPSVDVAYQLDSLAIDTVNRVVDVKKTAGGKGLNVTRVLSDIGSDVLATGFIGGQLGEFLKISLDRQGIRHQFFTIQGETRNCLALLHDGGKQTEVLEAGPFIDPDEADGFLQHLRLIAKAASVVTLSGSLPQGLPDDYYASIIAFCNTFHKKVVLDCSGESLLSVLNSPHKPQIIKPNAEELAQLLGQSVPTDDEQLKVLLAHPLFNDIEWIVVSLGADGAFAKHGEKYYRVRIPKIEVVNPVGSGDSTVAGLASALELGYDDARLLKHANALGILNAQEKLTGHVNMANYEALVEKIRVEEV